MFATLFIYSGFVQIVYAQAESAENMVDSSIEFNQFIYNDDLAQYNMRYAFAGDIEKPGILFIHGTPGSWSAFQMYLASESLQEDFFMISIDRIGWGGSYLEASQASKSTRKINSFSFQAGSISAVMKRYPNKKWLLLGHSLGASIAPKVTLINENVSAMLLLAGSLKPKLGKPRWFNRLGNTRLIRWLLPKQLKYSNDEIMVLKDELKILEAELANKKIDVDVVVMQGMKDNLVSPKNSSYVMQAWRSNFKTVRKIELSDGNHFLPWQQTQLVIKTIREFNY